MKEIAVLILVVSLIAPPLCAGDDSGKEAKQPPLTAQWSITKKKADDLVTATVEKDKGIVDAQSKSGIGSTALTLTQGAWPKTFLIRLHLKGLEGFSLKLGDKILSKKDVTITKKQGISRSRSRSGISDQPSQN